MSQMNKKERHLTELSSHHLEVTETKPSPLPQCHATSPMAQWNPGSKAVFLYIHSALLSACTTSTPPLTREALSMAPSLHNKVIKKRPPNKRRSGTNSPPRPEPSASTLLETWGCSPTGGCRKITMARRHSLPNTEFPGTDSGARRATQTFGGVVSRFTVRSEEGRAWQIEKLALPWYSWISPS